MTIAPIVLASSSPRRRQLLDMVRIPFRVIAPDVDEHVLPAEAPDHYVTRLARVKAVAVAARAPGELILAADTTVVLDGEIFGKPESPAHAVAMLTRLQGRTHEVMTGVAVLRDGGGAGGGRGTSPRRSISPGSRFARWTGPGSSPTSPPGSRSTRRGRTRSRAWARC